MKDSLIWISEMIRIPPMFHHQQTALQKSSKGLCRACLPGIVKQMSSLIGGLPTKIIADCIVVLIFTWYIQKFKDNFLFVVTIDIYASEAHLV